MNPKHSLFLLCTIIFAACSHSHDATQRIVDAWLVALNNHDSVAVSTFYDDSARVESPNWEGSTIGPAGVMTTYHRYFSSTPDLQLKITHLILTDTNAVIEYTSWGTLSNPESTTPDYMRGKKYSLQNCTRMTIVNGRITKQVSYFDQVAFLRQMGFFEQK